MSRPARFGIAVQMGLLLAVVGILAAGTTGFYAYQASRNLLLNNAKNDLVVAAQVIGRRVQETRRETARSLHLLSNHPATMAMLQQPAEAHAEQLATLFRLVMQAHPNYFQVRLISASEHGLERVRMDREGGVPIRVVGDDLQEKGHYAYVYDALKLPAGQTYFSRIVINHELGSHAGLGQPSATFSMPVSDAAGKALGVLVISLDLKSRFEQLSVGMPRDYQLFLANQQGDFLVHPDSSQTFGFDRGRRVLVQEEFPATAALVKGTVDTVVTEAREGRYAEAPVVAAFLGRKVSGPSSESSLLVGVALPLGTVVGDADRLGAVTLKIVLGLCLACLLLATLLARFIARPINRMSEAVQRFAVDHTVQDLPTERNDEVGVLARSFKQMQRQIGQQLADLQQSRKELEHLARHDVLTSLPNRRFFHDRLDHTLAQARRNGHRLALLFVDLDHFKSINDDIGHEAGDVVLAEVGRRLSACTREVDTVARLGGDEFVVLLDNPAGPEQIAAITEKLLDALKMGIPFDGRTLYVGGSIGISQYPQDGESAGEILANADRAMYRAKSAGRNGYQFFS